MEHHLCRCQYGCSAVFHQKKRLISVVDIHSNRTSLPGSKSAGLDPWNGQFVHLQSYDPPITDISTRKWQAGRSSLRHDWCTLQVETEQNGHPQKNCQTLLPTHWLGCNPFPKKMDTVIYLNLWLWVVAVEQPPVVEPTRGTQQEHAKSSSQHTIHLLEKACLYSLQIWRWFPLRHCHIIYIHTYVQL